MASGSNYLTTYYAKRIIGDTAAETATKALLQTGTGIANDIWILHRTNRANLYGIKYMYDDTTNGTADRIELYGGHQVSSVDTATAWVQLDTGDVYILGRVGINYDPSDNNNTYSLYVNGTTYVYGTTYLNDAVGIGYDPETGGNTYKLYVNGDIYGDDNTYINGQVGIGYNPSTTGNAHKLYVNGTTYLTDHLYIAAARHIYMSYNSTNYNILHNHDNGNVSLNAASAGLYMAYQNTTFVNWMNGRMELRDGCLSLFPNNSAYREGLRIHATGSWSDITLCGNDNTGNTGTSANSWFIGNNNGNFYIARNGSPGSTAYIGCVSNIWKFVTAADIPEGATNLSNTASVHTLSIYRNGITIPYQMDDTNDGGMLRVRGTAESNCILELGTWDDSGAGETIQFNYYPTTSQVTPTYSVSVPKHSGTLVTTDGHGASGTWGISISGNAATATCVIHPDASVSYIAGAKGSSAAVYAKKTYNVDHWYPAVTLETKGGGAWQIGNYNDETLEFQYATKANRDNNTNSTSEIYMTNGDTGRVITTGNRDNWTFLPRGHTHSVSELTWGAGVNLSCTGNNSEWSIDMNGTGSYWHVWSSTQSASCIRCYNADAHVEIPRAIDVGLNKSGSLIIGNPSGLNLAFDDNEMMARNNGAASTFYINSEGGLVYIGSGGLQVNGNITGKHTDMSGTRRDMQIRMGTINVKHNTQTSVTFSPAFSNACSAVIPWVAQLGFAAAQSVSVGSTSKTGCKLYQYNVAAVDCVLSYIAFGY